MENIRIYQKTSNGIQFIDMNEYLFNEQGVILIEEAITFELASRVIHQLTYLEKNDEIEEITIKVRSDGGIIAAGKMITNAMELCQKKIKTIATGPVASMATTIYLCGDQREMYKDASLMIHNPIYYLGQGSLAMDKASKLFTEAQKEKEAVLDIMMEQKLKVDRDTLSKLMDEEKVFDSKEAIEYGLAHQQTNHL